MQSTLFQKYNEIDALFVFSSYAREADSVKDMNALAWYTKHLISSFPRNRKVIFLAEKTANSSPLPYEDKGHILVIPCWQKNNLFSILDVIRILRDLSQPKRILFQFEFNMFGNVLGPLIMLFLTFYMAILRKKIYFQLHQIVLDISSLKDQINIKNSTLIRFYNLGLTIFYKLIFLLSSKIIVTEEALAVKLRSIGLTRNLSILHHHVLIEDSLLPQLKDKEVKTLLFFGYLSWYKGIDWLIDAFKTMRQTNPHLRLIIAGGESPTLKHKEHYKRYYKNLMRTIKNTKRVTHTGFITDYEVKKWFSKSDVLVMPYRAFISSSGPMSWALSQHKPVIFSSALKEYMKSSDFLYAMRQAGLAEKDLFFDFTTSSFIKVIRHLKIKKLSQFSSVLAKKRSQKNISKKLYKMLYSPFKESPKLTTISARLKTNLSLNYAK